MRSRVIAVLLAVLTVALGVWAFWPTDEQPLGGTDLPGDASGAAVTKDPRGPRRGGATPTGENAAPKPALVPLPPTAKNGRLVIHVLPESEANDPALKLMVVPEVATPVRTADGWRIDDVSPESYQITVYGQSVVPVVARGLRVQAAQTVEYTAKLETGVRVAGRIFDALSKSGVPGADVRFLDQLRLITDTDGRFQSDTLITRTALREITVKAIDYDQVVYRDFPILDPLDIQVAVGGGGCELVCKFENGLDGPLPKKMNAKIAISPGVWDVRREGDFDGRDEIRFKNLYATDYRVEVRFPEGEHPAILMPFTLKADEKLHELTLPLVRGATLAGNVLGPKEVVLGLKIELINARAEVIAQTNVSPEGVYAFKNLQPGEYIPRLRTGALVNQMPPLSIPSLDPMKKDIDVLRHAFVDPK